MTMVFRDEKGSELTADEFDANHGAQFTQASHGFAVGDVVYRSSVTAHAKAQADNADTLGEAMVAYVESASIFRAVSLCGALVKWTGHSKGSPPQKLWLSQGTAGEVVATKPSSGFIQEIGRTVDANTVMFRPDPVGEYV